VTSILTQGDIHGVNSNGWPPFPGRLWQRNYYERVIRDETEWNNARQYILDNPARWAENEENPANWTDAP
jgi:REP element-mobilizing transposase RayT